MQIHIDIDSPTKVISFHTEKCSYARNWEKVKERKEKNKTGTRMMIDSAQQLQRIKSAYTRKGYSINIHSKCIGEAILSI